jgi:hypothetical protein
MANLLDTLQATQAFAREFLTQPDQTTYDRMLAAAAIHVREVRRTDGDTSFKEDVLSFIDELPLFPVDPHDCELTVDVPNMLNALKFSRNPAAATLPMWNPLGASCIAIDIMMLAQYALAEDIRQVIAIS